MKMIIKNGRIIDPANRVDEVLDLLVEGEKIIKLGKNIPEDGAEVIDATGKIVSPGLVDMHVHLREPGREDKETIGSGVKAALKGGVTSVLAMPNTQPAIDSPENVRLLKERIKQTGSKNVFISAAITMQRAGKELTQLSSLCKEGVIAITDDGASVDDENLMQEAFRRAKKENVLVVCHCEDKYLSAKGVVNLGFTSTCMGLRGISKESEYKRISRDIELAEKSGARVHIAHVSCRESVEVIAEAKKRKVKVTAETAPHYFSLTERVVRQFDTNMKMNPPLRSQEDLESIKEGLASGVIDVIASDHAPHTENEKDIEFERAAFGVIGLETEVSVAITELIITKKLTWAKLIEKLAWNPAKILGIDKGTLSVGKSADIVIISPQEVWQVEKEKLVSKSKNSCFLGKKLTGRVQMTIVAGRIVYSI